MKTSALVALSFLFVVGLTLAPIPAEACTATCTGGSCSGTGSCGCVGGDPVCTDCRRAAFDSPDGVAAYAAALAQIDEPGIIALQITVAEIAEALEKGDLDTLQAAKSVHDEALAGLSLETQAKLRAIGCEGSIS